jgi:hypothetical protein
MAGLKYRLEGSDERHVKKMDDQADTKEHHGHRLQHP